MGSEKLSESLDGIAIIGMAGRFPGAKNVEEFWQNLRLGVESISVFTDEELIAAGIDPAIIDDANYVKAGGVLEDIELFDAGFFDFTPKEAEMTDPQHRLFLECANEALENAGYDSTRCKRRIGIYAGASFNNYLSFNLNRDHVGSAKCYQTLIGNDKDFLTTRVSYKLHLTGPSITIQTACSTSLVATILACQSLLSYQCDMALAGGVSIHTPQKTGYLHEPGGTLSPDGRCYAFDARAQGTTIGNGLGVVVLKRLEDAIVDGDCINAVIKGSAINNDGAMKVGYTAPSVDGQAEAIAEAIMLAGIEPETISYVEAHGTGTALGDPIEISALTKAFRTST
jgi:acyl transferase domain-containing protein